MFYPLILLGLILRLLLVPVAGFKADMAFWKGWGLAVADKGIIWLVKNTNYNYPPGFAYILYLINKTYAFFSSPYQVDQYWAEGNLLYLGLFKSLTVVADVAVVFLIIKIVKELKPELKKLALVVGLIYFFNPATLFDGSFWGQVDQFGLMLFLLAIYCLFKDKVKLGSVVFVVSFLMKFQNIIFIPLFYLFICKKYSWSKLITSLEVSLVTLLIVIAPFWWKREMRDLIRLVISNADYFPSYSLNSFNFWWIASGLKGMAVSDKNLVIGILNAKQVGLAMFVFAYFIASICLFFSSKEDLDKKFILSSCLAIFAFFHLLTESHERYLFPLIGLLLILPVYLPKEKRKAFFIFYALFSALFFLDMYSVMFFNYPELIIWPFTTDGTRALSLYFSIIQIGLFLYFLLVYVLPPIPRFPKKLIIAFGFLIIVALFFKNKDYLLGRPISLVSLAPINYQQDYLYPIYNKNLNTFGQPFAFGRLSSNYYFYDRGIASHANANITYGLGKRFSRFMSDYGLDTEAGASAQVYFVVLGDGRELFRSEKKSKFENPNRAEVNIKGVDKLVLRIENATGSIYGAHADWLAPVLIK